MKKLIILKFLSFGLSCIGGLLTVATAILGNKIMDCEIQSAVADAIAKGSFKC